MADQIKPSEEKTKLCLKCNLWLTESECAEHLESETHKSGVRKYMEEIDEPYDSKKYGPKEMLYYGKPEQSSAILQNVQKAELILQDMPTIENKLKECIRKLESLNDSSQHALSSLENLIEECMIRLESKYPQIIKVNAEAKDGEAANEYTFFCTECTATFDDSASNRSTALFLMADQIKPSEEKTKLCLNCNLGLTVSECAEHLESETHKSGVRKYMEEIYESYDSEKYGPKEMLYYGKPEQSSAIIQNVQKSEWILQDTPTIGNEFKECIRKLESLKDSLQHASSSLKNQIGECLNRLESKYPQIIIVKAEAKGGEAANDYTFFCTECPATFDDPDLAIKHCEKHEGEKRLVEAPKLE